MAQSQQGPWEIDEWNNIVDANDDIVILHGTVLPTNTQQETARANKRLILEAPSLNTVVGKVLEIMADPTNNDEQRMNKIYILTEELRSVYIPE